MALRARVTTWMTVGVGVWHREIVLRSLASLMAVTLDFDSFGRTCKIFFTGIVVHLLQHSSDLIEPIHDHGDVFIKLHFKQLIFPLEKTNLCILYPSSSLVCDMNLVPYFFFLQAIIRLNSKGLREQCSIVRALLFNWTIALSVGVNSSLFLATSFPSASYFFGILSSSIMISRDPN